MTDIYDTIVMCDKCKKPTLKSSITKNGFDIRTWHCMHCNKQWYHPADMEAYDQYMAIKDRDFQVKLRPVGNSFIVSIPKEIIRFQEISQTKVVNLHMDEPGKLTLRFTRVRKVY